VPESTTRNHILDVAEALFAEQGLDGVSLRRVNSTAGLNPAAVHYHFGSKQKLLEAILVRRMAGLMERRALLLARIEAGDWPADLAHLARALVDPLAELLVEAPREGRLYLRLLAQIYLSGVDTVRGLIQTEFAAGMARWFELVCQANPDVPRAQMALRTELLGQCVVQGLAQVPDGDPRSSVRAVLELATGGLGAPVASHDYQGDHA